MKTRRSALPVSLAMLVALATVAPGLGPHEVAILVNQNSPRSIALANHYAALRDIPPVNIIHLDVPDHVLRSEASISPDLFRSTILEPAQRMIESRQLTSHVMAWAYSLDFPARIDTPVPMSIHGLTFTRGTVPSDEEIRGGTFLSPLFRGPDTADGPSSPAVSLEQFTISLGERMPLPSMSLGFSGARGQSLDHILERLRKSVQADNTHPPGWVFYHQNPGDPRHEARAWQFEGAQAELRGLGVHALVTEREPRSDERLIGLMMGRSRVAPEKHGILLPGSIGDHLTSFAADFSNWDQTKLTAWLDAGATAAAGTVTEPGSRTVPVALWAKFPHARIFSHYASGASVLEAYYQAVRCPLQLLIVGDPLTKPWASPVGITLVNLTEEDPEKPVAGRVEFLASAWTGFGQPPPTMIFLLNGRVINHPGNQPQLGIDTRHVADGYHELRVIAYSGDNVRQQGTHRIGFEVANRGRQLRIGNLTPEQTVDSRRPFSVTLDHQGSGTPIEIALVAQERIIAQAPFTSADQALVIDPKRLGEGPVDLQGVAVYRDRQSVRTPPVRIHLAPQSSPPEGGNLEITHEDEERKRWSVLSQDPGTIDGRAIWYHGVLSKIFPDQLSRQTLVNTEIRDQEANFFMKSMTPPKPALRLLDLDQPEQLRRIAVDLQLPPRHTLNQTQHIAGIVFNRLDADTYSFVALSSVASSWIVHRVADGEDKRIESRGVPEPRGETYTLELERLPNGNLDCIVNGESIMTVDLPLSAGKIGLIAGATEARFSNFRVSPPSAIHKALRVENNDLITPADLKVGPLWVSLENAWDRALKPVDIP